MLTQNGVAQDKSIPKKERIRPDQIDTYIQQTPAKRLLGTNIPLWIYALSSPDTTNHSWVNRLLRNVGAAPVLLDTTQVRQSSGYISTYIHSRGFFNGHATYRIDTTKARKARVTYTLTQGEPYRIRSIRTTFNDRFVEPMIREDLAGTLLHNGMPFDTELLDKERQRIKDYLQNRGYYNFNVSNIRYNAYLGDTAAGDRNVDVEMFVEQNLTEYRDDGSPVLSNNAVYRLGRVNLYPDYDPMRALSDTAWIASLDTISYNGLNIIYSDRLRVREQVLRQSVSLYENYLFSATDVQRAYSNLMGLGYYKSARIAFADMASEQPNFVTFIGPDGSITTGEQTAERYLECNIYCTPSLRQGYNVGLETTFTSDYYGISVTGGYRNRNLFRGIEMFDLNLKGSYDWMRVKGKKTSFELGGGTSVTFPRFLLPRMRVLRNATTPRTMLSLSINAQRRPYYERVLSSISWGYSWSNGHHATFTIRPIDVSLVKMNNIDSTFFKSLVNPYLKESYQNHLLAGISGSWVYNNPSTRRGNSFTVRFNWETTGNLLQAVSALFDPQRNINGHYLIGGLQFAQYVRGDLSLSSNIPLGGRCSLAWRLYGGAAYTYGNSSVMPYDRLFWAGGANSMRGWAARTLGPGNELRPSHQIYPMQLGNMRLEANLEGRFPIWSIVGGAVFFDLGNVWYTGQAAEGSEASIFRFRNFYQQLGLNTGIGLRVDISMAVLRVDWGIRLHDPNQAAGERWIHNARMANTALSFTVGYPF